MAFNRAYKLTAAILAALLLVIYGCGADGMDDNEYVTVVVTSSGGTTVIVDKEIDTAVGSVTYTIPTDSYPLTISNVAAAGTSDNPLSLKITQVYLEMYDNDTGALIDTKNWYPDYLIAGNTSGTVPLPSVIDWDSITFAESVGDLADFSCTLTIYSTEVDANGDTGSDHVDFSTGTLSIFISTEIN